MARPLLERGIGSGLARGHPDGTGSFQFGSVTSSAFLFIGRRAEDNRAKCSMQHPEGPALGTTAANQDPKERTASVRCFAWLRLLRPLSNGHLQSTHAGICIVALLPVYCVHRALSAAPTDTPQCIAASMSFDWRLLMRSLPFCDHLCRRERDPPCVKPLNVSSHIFRLS